LRLKEDIMFDGMLTIFRANSAVPFKLGLTILLI